MSDLTAKDRGEVGVIKDIANNPNLTVEEKRKAISKINGKYII